MSVDYNCHLMRSGTRSTIQMTTHQPSAEHHQTNEEQNAAQTRNCERAQIFRDVTQPPAQTRTLGSAERTTPSVQITKQKNKHPMISSFM